MNLRGIVFGLFLLSSPAFPAALTDNLLILENIITSGTFTRPISMIFLSVNDLLIAEQHSGQVKRVINGELQPGNVLDLPVGTANEQGLLCIVSDPQFAANNFIYLYYTHAAVDGGTGIENRVMKYIWNGSELVGGTTLLAVPIPIGVNRHNAGKLVFGPPTVPAANQKLYVAVGDLDNTNKPQNYGSAGDADGSGCIIRINTDGTAPGDNPFYSVSGANAWLQRIYAYGIRNCFGLDFDHVSGALWDTENGPSSPAYDEINRVDAGFNSGWKYIMGPQSRNALMGAPSLYNFGTSSTYSDPEFSWLNPSAPAAIHFYRGSGLGAAYENDCFVGDSNNGNLYRFKLDGTRTAFTLTAGLADRVVDPGDSLSQVLFGTQFWTAADIKTGPDGNVYVLTLFSGPLWRIRKPTAAGDWRLY